MSGHVKSRWHVNRALSGSSPSTTTPTRATQSRSTYADAGVSIESGNRFVDNIKEIVKSTARPGSEAVIGGFGGLFDMASIRYQDPILVGSTDGVGTKLMVAHAIAQHETVGAQRLWHLISVV